MPSQRPVPSALADVISWFSVAALVVLAVATALPASAAVAPVADEASVEDPDLLTVRFEFAQEGSLVRGCYTDTSGRGGGSLAGSVENGIAHLQWIDGRNPKVAGSALFVKDSRGWLSGIWYRLPGRTPRAAEPAPAGTTTPCSAAPPSNPVADALAASGEAILYGIYFDFDEDTLKSESEPVLRQLLAALAAAPDLAIDIEGHTDSVGADAYNQDLSARRAQAVVAWLVEHEIAAARLTAVGKGEAEPVASNDTADGRALNRRVEARRR